MSHYLKKIGSSTLIRAAINKTYWLSEKSAHDWSIEDSEDGNTVELYCPQTQNNNDLVRGEFYQLFAITDKVNPIAAFQLIDINYQYQNTQKEYVWKLSGKSWRDIANRIVIHLNSSRIRFKQLCSEILRQTRLTHSAFSANESFIEDHNFEFRNYRAKAYLPDVIADLKKTGYQIWFDASMQMVARHEDTASIYVVNYDSDYKIADKQITTRYFESPAGMVQVRASKIISSEYTSQTFTATGKIEDTVYSLSSMPAEPIRTLIPFAVPSDLTNNFDTAPIGVTADSLIEGRLQVANLALGIFDSHKRNYKKALNGSAGLTIGSSLAIHQSTGIIATHGIQIAPADQPSSWIAGFYVENKTLKIIFNGLIESIVFPSLIPTIRADITAISANTVSISGSSNDYVIGETVYFEKDNQIIGLGIIQSKGISTITFAENVQIDYSLGIKLLQQADYIFKISYNPGQIIYYAKKGTDEAFTIVQKKNLTLSGDLFLQLYANDEHSISFDFLDIQENLETFLSREANNDGNTIRNYDVAFEDSASQLQSEVQIFSENEVWKARFEAIPTENIKIITAINSVNSVTLNDIEGLSVGDRALISDYARNISSIVGNAISWTEPIASINSLIPVYKTDTHPGKYEIITIKYKTLAEDIIPLCSSVCSASSDKSSLIVDLDSEEQIDYQTFRELAENEVNRVCLPYLAGSFSIIIESNRINNQGLTGILADIPQVGQKIRINSPRFKTDFHDLEAYISDVKLMSVGHSNTFKIEVVIGDQGKNFDVLLYRLRKQVTKTSNLINDSIPDETYLCTQKVIGSSTLSISLSTDTAKTFRNESYSVWVNELVNWIYSANSISLSNVSKQSARNQLSNGFINGLAN